MPSLRSDGIFSTGRRPSRKESRMHPGACLLLMALCAGPQMLAWSGDASASVQDQEPLPPLFPPPPPPPPPPLAPSLPLELAAPRPETLPVVLEADGLPLQLSVPHGSEEPLCTTPCTLHLPPGGFTLHASAPGRILTRVSLNVQRPGQRVVLQSASGVRLISGVGLVITGGMLTVGGLLLTGLNGFDHEAAASQQGRTGALAFAAGMTIAGFGSLVGGGFLLRGLGWGVKRVTPLPESDMKGDAL